MAVMQVSQLPAAGRATRFQGSSRPRVTAVRAASKHGYKVVVVGGGSGGAAVAAHYARKLPGQVAVVEVRRCSRGAPQHEGHCLPAAWSPTAAAPMEKQLRLCGRVACWAPLVATV